MNPMMQMMGYGMFPGQQMGPQLRNQMMEMRALRYMRPPMEHMPAPPRSRMGQSRNPFMGVSQDQGPDFSPFTYDPALRQQAMQAGVTPLAPEQVQQNTILPNSGWFGNHPRFSAGLERLMYNAAGTQGAETWGQGITNVAQGIIGGGAMQRNAWQRQFAQPFEAAQQLRGLQDSVQKRDLQEAEIQHFRAETERLRSPIPKPDHAITPLTVHDPAYVSYDEQGRPTLNKNPYWNSEENKPNRIESGVNKYLDSLEAEWKAKNPGKEVPASVRRGWLASVPHVTPPGPMMIDPSNNMPFRVTPGNPVPSGAVTPSQAGGAPAKANAERERGIQNILKTPRLRHGAKIGISDDYDAAYKKAADQWDAAHPQANPTPTPSKNPTYNIQTGRVEP